MPTCHFRSSLSATAIKEYCIVLYCIVSAPNVSCEYQISCVVLTAVRTVHAVCSSCRGHQGCSYGVQDGSRRHENDVSALCSRSTDGVLFQQGRPAAVVLPLFSARSIENVWLVLYGLLGLFTIILCFDVIYPNPLESSIIW